MIGTAQTPGIGPIVAAQIHGTLATPRMKALIGDLKEIAQAQADEINRQNPLIDAVEERVENVTNELRNNNVKLKQVVTSIRSTRKFCIDFILLMVVLGIGMYIFSVVT